MIMYKRGLSHVEFIVSLAIFLAFVIFMLTFLSPFDNKQTNDATLEILEKSIIKYGSIEVLTGSVVVSNAGNDDCFSVESLDNKNVVVRFNNGRIDSKNVGEETAIENKGNGVYSLYYSDSFDEVELNGCSELEPGSCSLGLTREKNIIYLEKLKELAEIYNNRYADAKEAINFPEESDFGFVLYELNGGVSIEAFKKKTSGDVNAKEINIEVIDKDANIKSMIVNLRVW